MHFLFLCTCNLTLCNNFIYKYFQKCVAFFPGEWTGVDSAGLTPWYHDHCQCALSLFCDAWSWMELLAAAGRSAWLGAKWAQCLEAQWLQSTWAIPGLQLQAHSTTCSDLDPSDILQTPGLVGISACCRAWCKMSTPQVMACFIIIYCYPGLDEGSQRKQNKWDPVKFKKERDY